MARSSFSNGFANASSKSMTEALPEILSSNATKAQKADAMFKLGLRKSEVEYFLHSSVRQPRPVSHRFTFTFGVEIECITNCVGVQRELGNNLIHIESYNHTDHHDNIFKFVSDSSVRDNSDASRYDLGRDAIGAAECVSPVLKSGNGYSALKKVVTALKDNGGYVNKSCGLHVHIGADMLSDEQYINVFKNYQKLESLIDSFMAPSRRGDCRWACSLVDYNFNACQTRRDVDYIIGTRYCKVNPESWSRHHTIEFRQHQGTINYKKISMWIHFLGKLVQYSMNNVLSEVVTSIDAIPFLNKTEKNYYKARQSEFANRG